MNAAPRRSRFSASLLLASAPLSLVMKGTAEGQGGREQAGVRDAGKGHSDDVWLWDKERSTRSVVLIV